MCFALHCPVRIKNQRRPLGSIDYYASPPQGRRALEDRMTRASDKPWLPRLERYLTLLCGQPNEKSFAHPTWENALGVAGAPKRAAPHLGVAIHEKTWAPLPKLHHIQNDPLNERSDTFSTMCILVVTEHCQSCFWQIYDLPKIHRTITTATIRIGTQTDTKTNTRTCTHTHILYTRTRTYTHIYTR